MPSPKGESLIFNAKERSIEGDWYESQWMEIVTDGSWYESCKIDGCENE